MSYDLAALSRRWFVEVWNRRNVGVIDELTGTPFLIHGLSEDRQLRDNKDDFRRFHAMFTGAFPDLKVTVEDVLVDGDRSAVRLSFTGTHMGPQLGIAPTGRRFNATAIVIIRWQDGKIVEGWNEFDADGMMKQLTATTPMQLRV
jgi:predicted ester cyclase